jgi:hypothetical protein
MARRDAGLPIVVLVPRHATSWVKFFDLANAIRADGRFQPLLALPTAEMAQRASECQRAGLAYADMSEALQAAVQSGGRWLQAVGAFLDRLAGRFERVGNCLPLSLLRMHAMRRRLRAEYQVFRDFFGRTQPVAVCVPGDRELSPVPPVLKAAGDAGIARLNAGFGVPWVTGVVHQREPYVRFRVDWPAIPLLLNVFAARKWPQQVLHLPESKLLFSPGWLLLALNAEGMMAPNPWVQGGGLSDYLLQNSRPRIEGFLQLGVPAQKIFLTGDPTLDLLHRSWKQRSAIRSELASSYGFATGEAMVVMSVPNDPEHGLGTFAEHRERMEGYFRCLSQSGIKCLLSLHPKSKPETYRDLAEKWGHRIVARPLAEYLPAVDLFICSASSVMLWAQLVNIPILNLDYRALRDPDYLGMPGIIEIKNEGDLLDRLSTWRNEGFHSKAFEEHSEKLRRDSLFDGVAGERLCNFVADLANIPSHSAA